MGRKKSPKKKAMDAHAETDSLLRDGLLEIFLSLFELGAAPLLVDTERQERPMRQKLVISLERLSKFVSESRLPREIPARAHEGVSLTHSDENESALIQLEVSALEIRLISKDFADLIKSERRTMLQIQQQLENMCRTIAAVSSTHPSLYVQQMHFIRQLLSQYHHQLNVEETMLNDILMLLSRIYDGKESGFDQTEIDTKRIGQWNRIISERTFLEKDYWNLLPTVIDKVHSRGIPASDENILEMGCPSISSNLQSFVEKHVPCGTTSWLDQAQTIGEAVDIFLGDDRSNHTHNITFLLIIGDQGSGKSYLCDEVERKVDNMNTVHSVSVRLIRPSIPLDLMGRTVGEIEDSFISLFECAQAHSGRCIVVLDDIEHVIGDNAARPQGLPIYSGEASHVAVRTKATLFGIMDSIRQGICSQERMNACGCDVLVVCSARDSSVDMVNRFDKVFVLEPPADIARKAMIISGLGLTTHHDTQVQELLSKLVEETIGRSFAEIAQYCRRAINLKGSKYAGSVGRQIANDVNVLHSMLASLRSLLPESLRSGSLDYADMSVSNARDLLMDEKLPVELPMYGDAAMEAWRQLKRLIVTPLCRSKAFDEIMFGSSQSSSREGMCAGVLLTGPSGSGKSMLARHCAKFAASILDSLTLLDVSCTSLVHKEVGGSERALKRLFLAARAAAPCILLMDGIENIAAVRGNDNTTEGTMDRMLSTLLTELDGVDESLSTNASPKRAGGGIAVIGISQYPNMIDPALLRPGRLEKTVHIEHPDFEARQRLVLEHVLALPLDLEAHSEGRPSNPHELADFVARSNLATAADLVAVCQEASLVSVRRLIDRGETEVNAKISFVDFQAALDARFGSTCRTGQRLHYSQ